MIQLRSLTLIPHSGMCNRLLAIASARRLCKQTGANCSVVWDWGEFASLFLHPPDITIVKSASEAEKTIRHQPFHINPTRSIDVTVKSLNVYSGYIFWGNYEPAITIADVLPFIPRLNQQLQAVVNKFSSTHLKNSIGFHLRRTDQSLSVKYSPDILFFQRARKLIADGKNIFLATDNLKTETKMKKLFGDKVITYQKRTNLERRWPRRYFDQIAAEDDLIDLFLLTKTEFVLGSYFSSYSSLAMALNDSPHCSILRIPKLSRFKTFLTLGLLYYNEYWAQFRKRLSYTTKN